MEVDDAGNIGVDVRSVDVQVKPGVAYVGVLDVGRGEDPVAQ